MFTRDLMLEWQDQLAQTFDEKMLDIYIGKQVTYVGKLAGRPDSWVGSVVGWSKLTIEADKTRASQFSLITKDLVSHVIHRQANIRYEGEPAPLKEEGITPAAPEEAGAMEAAGYDGTGATPHTEAPAGGDEIDTEQAGEHGPIGKLEPSGSSSADGVTPSLR